MLDPLNKICSKLLPLKLVGVLVSLALTACGSTNALLTKEQEKAAASKNASSNAAGQLDPNLENSAEDEFIKGGEISKKANFDLRITAVKSARVVLDENLDLLNFRYIKNLSSNDLNQLILQLPRNIEQLLALQGYFNPTIEVERINRNDNIPLINIYIKAGPRTRVENIELEFMGDIVYDNSPEMIAMRHEVYESWPLNSNNFFTQERWSNAKKDLLNQLTTKYFIDAKMVLSKVKVRANDNRADLHIRFDSGKRYSFGGIATHGLERYEEEWVQNLLRINSGSSYDQLQVLAAQDRLIASGYFESVNISTETASDAEQNALANLEVHLKEFKRKKGIISLGVTTDSGARIALEYNDNKVPYFHVKNSTKLELDKNHQSLEMNFTTPINSKNWYWQLDNKLTRDKLLDLTSRQHAISIGRVQKDQRMDRGVYLSRLQTWDKSDDSTDSASAIVAKAMLNYRHLNDYINPSEGWGVGIDLGLGLVTTKVKQPSPFVRTHLRWLGFLPINNQFGRLFFNAGVGVVKTRKDVRVPTSELFYAGGINSVRGYKYRSIGVEGADGKAYPAKIMYLFSAEWQRPLRFDGEYSGWDSIVFVDSAYLSDSLKINDADWKTGVGIGVRWGSPVGLLNVSIARALKQRRFRLHLSLGLAF